MYDKFFTLQNDLRTGDDLPDLQERTQPGYGQWHCVVDKTDSNAEYFHVLEIHKGSTWVSLEDLDTQPRTYERGYKNKAVVRVSEYSKYQGIRLGQCALLTKEQMVQVRDLLNEMIAEAEVVDAKLASSELGSEVQP
jgi:hypothetical protein